MSFYTSLSGLKNAQTDLAVISHNLANVETTGFKGSRTNFADIVANSAFVNPRQTTGVGSAVASVTQGFTQGTIEQTGGTLDLAITGDGFFATKSASSTGAVLFTRNGSFKPDSAGFVQDGAGNRLQLFPVDANGDVAATGATIDAQLPATNAAGSEFAGVTIDERGEMAVSFADGTSQILGRVALASFVAPESLKQLGSSNWEATGRSGEANWGVAGDGKFGELTSGALERSNVDITEELVNLITAQRNFQANAKAIDTNSQITQTILGIRT